MKCREQQCSRPFLFSLPATTVEWFNPVLRPTKLQMLMSNKSSHHESHENSDEQNEAPRTRPIHHSWIFWVAVVLVLVAMLTYVFTMDLATRPVPRGAQPAANTVP